ncbi:hypothetical protein R3P38DRAFT_2842939 [Favolaschia claudopus]|uniref:EthD domain-containing protein n=1 Tax=Favolaschia claudopus TaxID=2862362 RepID=A0AAW0E0U4_9AGAR
MTNCIDVAETLKPILGHPSPDPAVYRTLDDTSQRVLAIFCVVHSQINVPEVNSTLLGPDLDIRLYETVPSAVKIVVPTSPGKHYMVFNGMTPNDDAESEFNDWYTEEHIPMLSVAPGWRSSNRFRVISTAATSSDSSSAVASPPQYMALHEWSSLDVFESAEFKAATTTSWRTKVVMEQVNKKERYLLEYVGTIQDLART